MSDPFFPRGDGPLVSVILPTRHRKVGLCTAIDSIYSLAKDKSNVEFLLKIDDDDTESIKVYETLQKLINIRAWITPRGNGYLDMHKWVNELSLNWAKGDWVFLTNDDAVLSGAENPNVVDGQNWDEKLTYAAFESAATWHGCPDVCSLIAPTVGRPDAAEFFFVRRKTIQVLGHYALNPHTDNYLQNVLCAISSSFRFQIYVVHKSEEVKDVLRGEVLEAYKKAGKDLNTLECMRNRQEDVSKLLSYIEDWRRKRCAVCRKFLTDNSTYPSLDSSYIHVNSGCNHGNFIICKECVNDNKIGVCPVCGLEAPVFKDKFVVSF